MASPAPGQPAPEFTLEGVEDGVRGSYSLASARGAALILAFYPGDDTPGCTKQLCSYQDDLGQLTGLGARLWGISPQNIESHERFAKKRGLTFPLLADPDRLAIKAYGVNGPLGHTRRSVFVLDAEGVVRWSHVGMLGITFQSSEKLAAALKAI